MKGQGLQRNRKRGRRLAGCAAALMVAGAAAGCTAYDPQGAAQQYAPSYYNQSYDQLSARTKDAARGPSVQPEQPGLAHQRPGRLEYRPPRAGHRHPAVRSAPLAEVRKAYPVAAPADRESTDRKRGHGIAVPADEGGGRQMKRTQIKKIVTALAVVIFSGAIGTAAMAQDWRGPHPLANTDHYLDQTSGGRGSSSSSIRAWSTTPGMWRAIRACMNSSHASGCAHRMEVASVPLHESRRPNTIRTINK